MRNTYIIARNLYLKNATREVFEAVASTCTESLRPEKRKDSNNAVEKRINCKATAIPVLL